MNRAFAASDPAGRDRSAMFVALAGGSTHHETYDPKPYAPCEYRGLFGDRQVLFGHYEAAGNTSAYCRTTPGNQGSRNCEWAGNVIFSRSAPQGEVIGFLPLYDRN